MLPALRPRLRQVAGLTLLVLTLVILIAGAIIAGSPYTQGSEDWNQLYGPTLIIVCGAPTLLAALGVLLGGSVGGIFGGLVSLVFATVAALLLTAPSSAPAVVAAGLAAALGFGGVASLVTRHDRDKPRVSAAP